MLNRCPVNERTILVVPIGKQSFDQNLYPMDVFLPNKLNSYLSGNTGKEVPKLVSCLVKH